MLEPVKRINYDSVSGRIENKKRVLSLGKEEKKRDGSQTPRKEVYP